MTLDASILFELWVDGRKASVTERILNLARSGILDLTITSRVNDDIPNPPLAGRISELPTLGIHEIGSVFRLDRSGIGRGNMPGTDEFLETTKHIENVFDKEGRVRKRPNWKDWDHLHGHFLKKRDVFLVWDGPILDAATELKEQLGIVVMKPEDFVATLSELSGEE